jgi:hypothetical protein
MATQIISGSSSSQLIVDPVSGAFRSTVYTTDGLSIFPADTYRGIASIVVAQTATTGAAAVVWGIYNPSATRTIYIKEVSCQLLFNAGTSVATIMKYEFVKGTGCTAFSGGAAVTPLHKKTAISSPAAQIRVLDTGLTATGASFGGSMLTMAQARVAATALYFTSTIVQMPFEAFREFPIELAQNEIFALRQLVTSVVTDTVYGYVEFSEA